MEPKNPLDEIEYPAVCNYPGCGFTLLNSGEADEHITEEHLPEAIWTFAHENLRPK